LKVTASSPDIADALCSISGCSVALNVPLSGFTTWKTGGPARYMIQVENREALRDVLLRVREAGVETLVLGNGSNVLAADRGFTGAVLRLKGSLSLVDIDGDVLSAGAGASLGAAVQGAARASLSGLEFALGIPGTAGGAVMTNAATRTGSTAGVLREVEVLNVDGDEEKLTSFADAYREPLVPLDNIVTAASFKLDRAEVGAIKARMEEARAKREATQPVGAATAGSVFKNPPGDSAGRLLDACGLKGKSIGAATVSPLHANFIVNVGGAKAADIRALMETMVSEVKDRFGIDLKPEVRLIGFKEER